MTLLAGQVVNIAIGGLAGSTIAGTPQGFTVTAFAADGDAATDYTGTVRFSSTDLQGGLPAEYTFTAGDSGSHSFAATLRTAGVRSLTVADTADPSLTATKSIIVSPATHGGFVVSGFTSGATAGVSQSFGVSAVDAYGNVTPSYTGAVRISSSDPLASVPANYQFTASDKGTHNLSSTLKTAGVQSLTATDTVSAGLVGSRTGIVVVAAAAKNFSVSGFPSPTVAGTPGSVTVTARDAYGNVATSYSGTVRFTSTDPAATLPADYAFTAADAGVHAVQVTLYNGGLRTITATDVATATIVGKQQNIRVTAAQASRFTISAPVDVDAGHPFQIRVTAKDAYANVAIGYTGTIHFTSDDFTAALPADSTFTAADAGVRTFTVTLEQNGRRKITATDVATPAITGFQSNIYVTGGTAGYDPATNTIYAYGAGTFTLGQLKGLLPAAPLTLIDTANHVWYLGANIVLKDGAVLNLHGTSMGGDVDELRLKSDNTGGPSDFVSVRAIYGAININSTKITSWDSAVDGPDTETDLYGRAYIGVRSFFAPDGVTPLESRMDIYSSDIGYLGSHNSEAYGLTWKAAGYGAELHSRLHVYGDVYDTRIHHNFFGIYTWGAYGMNIVGNETDHNVWYGIDPHDDSNNLLIEGNFSHDNGTHGIIASQHCNNIIIRNNVSINNGKHGIMLHRSSNNGLIEGNTVTGNGEMGIAVFESFNATIRNNTVSGNLTGIRFSMGAGDGLVENNHIFGNIKYGISSIMGSDPKVVNDGRPAGNVFRGNDIHDNGEYGIRIKEGDRNLFEGNNIYNNPIRFEVAIDNILTGNTLAAGVLVENAGDATTTTRTILRDQSNVRFVLEPFSAVVAESTTGGVFRVDDLGEKHDLGVSGSSLTLDSGDHNGETLVLGLTNLAAVATAPATITPTVSGSTGTVSGWTTQASVSPQSIEYLLTGLVPNSSYTITKGGSYFILFTTDSSGAASFSDVAGTLNPVVYSLTRV